MNPRDLPSAAIKALIGAYLRLRLMMMPRLIFREEEVKTILVMVLSPLGIGDELMTAPALRALKATYPEAHITLLSDKPILSRSRELYSEHLKIAFSPRFPLRLRKELKGRYDLVIVPQKNLLQSVLAVSIRKKYLLGYIFDWEVRANFPVVAPHTYTPRTHYYDCALFALENIGVGTPTHKDLEPIPFTEKELAKVKSMIGYDQNRKYVTINPRVLWESRTWPVDRYIELLERLISDYDCVVAGGPSDKEYNRVLDERFRNDANYHNVTGKTNLFELAALCSITDLFITGDSGPMHIALAQRTPTLALFGPVHPLARLPLDRIEENVWYIYPEEHPGAAQYDLEWQPWGNTSMAAISVDAVEQAAREALER